MSDIEIIKKFGSIENYIYELEQENKQLKEVIEEVRECVNKCVIGIDVYSKPVMLLDIDEGKELLQILDKVGNSK